MANVQVIQRNAHLAGAVKLDQVNGRDGKLAKAVLTAISNTRRGSGDERARRSRPRSSGRCGASRPRTPPSTSARAATSTSSGTCATTTTRAADGGTVYALAFTCDEIDYLDSKRAALKHGASGSEFVADMEAHEQSSRAAAGVRLNASGWAREPTSPFTIEENHHDIDHPDPRDPLWQAARACCAATAR